MKMLVLPQGLAKSDHAFPFVDSGKGLVSFEFTTMSFSEATFQIETLSFSEVHENTLK